MMQHGVQGTILAPPSKSITHRAYLLAAQSDRPCTIHSPLRAADTDATLDALRAFGANIQDDGEVVHFRPATLQPPTDTVDCGNSGTTLRFLLALAARMDQPVTLDGDHSLHRRPNAELLVALRDLGADTDAPDGDHCPITVQRPLRAGEVTMSGAISSQFTSALLLSLPMLDAPSTLTVLPPVVSRPYMDITTHVADAFGLRIDRQKDTYTIHGGDTPRCAEYHVTGDWSSAAFMFVAAAITGGRVTVQGLDSESPQGDRAVLEHLESFGCTVQVEGEAVTVEGGGLESPGYVDVQLTPDLFPALAVLAACSRGLTNFTGGASLRLKESDRIAAMADGLNALGIHAEERPEGLIVQGGTPSSGSVEARADHRVHMAFQVLGLAADGPIQLDGEEVVRVSYPSFHDHLQRLTGGNP